jgi:hypothetical protein
VRFALTEFEPVFEIRDRFGAPHIIIGGQAVNYWAETYLKAEPELARFLPFVSKDIDFLGGLDDVKNAAQALRAGIRLPHKKMMTAFAGAVRFQIGGMPANVEFVRVIPGVTVTEVRKSAVAAEYKGRFIRVVDPVSLLACKLDLALTVDQTGRRDADHVRILMLCVRAFLRETLRGVTDGNLPARGWLGAAERMLKLAESKLGRRAVQTLNLNWREAFPVLEIGASRHRLITRFRQQRWKVWLEKNAAGE